MMENILKDYIDKLIAYLEQDYELQDYIFVGYRIKYRVKKSILTQLLYWSSQTILIMHLV